MTKTDIYCDCTRALYQVDEIDDMIFLVCVSCYTSYIKTDDKMVRMYA